jgi:predicted lipid-binding transport protein (Tim44 family)
MSFFNFVAWLLSPREDRSVSMWTNDDISPDAFAEMSATAGLPAAANPLITAPSKPMWQQAKDQIGALQKIDPNFSDVAFLESATQTYQAALCAENDLNADALGDAATQSFHDQLAQRFTQWRSSGMVRKVSDLKLDPPTLMKISVDGMQQLITVRFTGTAARYTTDATSGIVTDGSKQPDLFTEFATFVRPAGTTTPTPISAGAPVHCPGCGAPVEPGRTTCPYCNTPLSGTGAAWQIDHLSASPYT